MLSNLADKIYTSAPTLTFAEPTSVDADGNPLGTNVTATATVQLDSEGEVSGVTIVEDGHGYIKDPVIRVASPTESEGRGKDVAEIAIIMLNHVANVQAGSYASGFKTLNDNKYFERKNNYYDCSHYYWKKYVLKRNIRK